MPPLGEKSGSSSDPYENQLHVPAHLQTSEFNVIQNLKPLSFRSVIWTYKNKKTHLEWDSETDILVYVKLVLDDAISAAGLQGEIICLNELGIFCVRPDMWILVREGFPIGVIEVKKPGKDIMNSSQLHGQIFDYMMRLRSFYGQKHVFGIVSTYSEWRIYWLSNSDCDKAASATKVKPSHNPTSFEDIDSIPEWLEDIEDDTTQDLIPPSTEKRILHGTNVIKYNSQTLAYTLASVILKMYSSPHITVPLVDSNRSYILLNETSWYWVHFNRGLNYLKVTITY